MSTKYVLGPMDPKCPLPSARQIMLDVLRDVEVSTEALIGFPVRLILPSAHGRLGGSK